MNPWRYDERQHCGIDYSKATQAEINDEQHQKFRDFAKEFKGMAERLTQSGITVFVLKYRLPMTPGTNFLYPVPLSDALRAILSDMAGCQVSFDK